MNLTLFFRLIIGSIFQSGTQLNYHSTYFYCPRVWAKDGKMNISLQVNCGNYCESTAGYRKLSDTFTEVEFGFPIGLSLETESLMSPFGELNQNNDNRLDSDVGRIPIEVLEQVYELHGGIDWEKTISTDWFNKITN